MTVSLHKLERLPRNQRLRKITKIFAEAENLLCAERAKKIDVDELAMLANFLAGDEAFSLEAQAALKTAAGVFMQAIDTSGLRRSINTIKHILLNETGRSQADWDFTGSDGSLDPAKRRIFPGMFVYLEDIRSPFNVGAMFRTAESFGAEKIFLSPFCADPKHKRAERTAMGCVAVLPWERKEFFATSNIHISLDLTSLSTSPVPIFALETGGIPLENFPFPPKGLLIAGSEELGVSPQALAAADASLGRVSIPCYGAKGSLNVSVAFGIVMQAWAKSCIIKAEGTHA